MRIAWFALVAFLFLASSPVALIAQGHGGGGGGWAERLVIVVPMTGKGTFDDARRPDFGAAETKELLRAGWRYEVSDDGKYAIVLLSGAQPGHARAAAAKAAVAEATVFERGRNSKHEIEKAMKKYRKDFSFDRLAGIPALDSEVAK